MNLVEILAEQARARPGAAAIIEERRGVTTFEELELCSARVAARLRESGLRPGDPALIFHPMSAELYAVLLGVFRIGAVAMFLDPSVGREHIARCCELQPPAALIAGPKAHLLRLVSSALRRIPRKFTIGAAMKSGPAMKDCEPSDGSAAALLTFTSGSTGLPKAAVRTHDFLIAQHEVLRRQIDLVPGEMDLTTLPIFLLANLASGVTSVIPGGDLRSPGSVAPGPILAQIVKHGVTRCAASPAFFERLLNNDHQSAGALAGLRKIFTGGAPVFPRLLERLSASAPHAKVEAVYGSTEAEPIAHLDAAAIHSHDRDAMRCGDGLLAGQPIPEIRLRIMKDAVGKPIPPLTDDEFERLQLPPGQAGEIVVSGPHVLKTYLHGHGNEETKFQVGNENWHRTGDAGRLDNEGRLWLLGRSSAKVSDTRGDIFPFCVECVPMEFDWIRRAAFVSHGGRRLLVIEIAHEPDDASLTQLKGALPWAKLDEILPIGRIPVDKRHNAKIDYPSLNRLLEKNFGKR